MYLGNGFIKFIGIIYGCLLVSLKIDIGWFLLIFYFRLEVFFLFKENIRGSI